MHVLDTDVVTLLQYPDNQRARHLVARLTASNQTTAVTITTFEEQVRGRLAECSRAKTPEAYSHAANALQRLISEYQNRVILPFDDRAASEFRRLKALKVRIGTMDLHIACIALVNNSTLITMNRRDYDKVPSLSAEDWTTGSSHS